MKQKKTTGLKNYKLFHFAVTLSIKSQFSIRNKTQIDTKLKKASNPELIEKWMWSTHMILIIFSTLWSMSRIFINFSSLHLASAALIKLKIHFENAENVVTCDYLPRWISNWLMRSMLSEIKLCVPAFCIDLTAAAHANFND